MARRYGLGPHLAASTAARTGEEMSGPALLLAGMAVAGSVTAASATLAALTATAAVGGPLLGALLDRAARPGRLLAGALTGYAAGLVLVVCGLGRVPLPAVLLTAAATGVLGPALSGGWTSQVGRLVPAGRLARANALDAMTFGASAMAGPALAGCVAAVAGPVAAVAAAAALVALAAPAARRLPARVPSHAPAARPSLAADLRAGARCLAERPALAAATAVSALSCAGEALLVTCAPLAGRQVLGGADRGALLLSAAALASLTASGVLARAPRPPAPDTVLRLGALAQAAGTLLAATCRPVPLVAGALLCGAGTGPQLTALFAVRHREAPDHLRAQVFTTGASLKITAFSCAAALAGPLAERSLPAALAVAAALHTAGAARFVLRWAGAVRGRGVG